MEIVQVDCLDHLGIIAGVIKDLGIIALIDERIHPNGQEKISPGEAVAGMILNGLGFSHHPLSLTPQFFENKPLDRLFRPEGTADWLHRLTLGRVLDQGFDYGWDLLFSDIALSVCPKEGRDLRFTCRDTTTFSLTGAYVPETDAQAILITYGSSKDPRPDLKQAV